MHKCLTGRRHWFEHFDTHGWIWKCFTEPRKHFIRFRSYLGTWHHRPWGSPSRSQRSKPSLVDDYSGIRPSNCLDISWNMDEYGGFEGWVFRIFSRFSMVLSIKVTNISSMTWMIRMPGGFPPLHWMSKVQLVEIYNDQLRDLLAEGDQFVFLLCGLLESISYLY